MSHKQKIQITLRGLPDRFFHEIKEEARREQISINEALLRRLNPDATGKTRGGACVDLLSLAGTWDPERVKDFEEQMKGHRRIDPELWA